MYTVYVINAFIEINYNSFYRNYFWNRFTIIINFVFISNDKLLILVRFNVLN